ncbi:MAG: hypothetical protein JXL97_13405 [Bacteroidales bacterium]|nr:hypothetical protein [Bacteroidales bacterium]
MKIYNYILLFIFAIMLFTNCYKQPVYPPEPKIDFRQIVVIDSVEPDLGNVVHYYNIYFKIVDGDGNFGVNTDSKDFVDSLAEENFFIDLYYLDNGNIFLYEFPEDINLNGIIPYVDPVGLNDYYKALVICNLEVPITLPYPVKFEFYVEDNDKNRSNTQSTPWIEPGFTGALVDTNNIIID